jgi:hypothetical protein
MSSSYYTKSSTTNQYQCGCTSMLLGQKLWCISHNLCTMHKLITTIRFDYTSLSLSPSRIRVRLHLSLLWSGWICLPPFILGFCASRNCVVFASDLILFCDKSLLEFLCWNSVVVKRKLIRKRVIERSVGTKCV